MKRNPRDTDAGGRAMLSGVTVGRRRSTLAPTSVIALVAHLVAFLAPARLAYAEATPPAPPAPPPRPARLLPRLPTRPGAPPAPAPAPPPPAPAPAPAAAKPGAAPAKPGVVELPGEKEFNSCKKLPSGKRIVKLNLKPETDVIDLVGWISSITCSQFLVSVPLQGKKVTIIAPQLITPEEAYRLFFAALESVGLTVEPSGKFLRIVETARARFTTLPFVGANESVPHNKRYVTKLVRVSYLDTNDLTNAVLNRLKSESADIISYRSSLIITDQSENIERMVNIIRQFDTPSANRDKIWMIRIKNTSAIDMAGRIAEIMPVQQLGSGQKRQPGSPPPAPPKPQPGPPGDLSTEMTITKIVPDERSNSLIVVANQRAYDWLVSLVHKLDVSPEESVRGAAQDRFHIYNCANANCDELAATLSAITGVQVVGSLATGVRRRGSSTAPTAAAPAQNQQGGNQSALMFEGDVRVTFDAPTNSLLVMSSFKDFQALRRVIEKLDAPRKQVFIEALILEVTTDKARQMGVSYHAGKGQDVAGQQSLLLGGFNANQTLGAAFDPKTLLNNMGGLSAALFGPAINPADTKLFGVLNVNIPSFGVFLQLLQTNNDVNVLSNPHILIMNNQEGEITVGENLPFPGAMMGTALTGGATVAPYLSVNRQDVALKLKLLPSVNEHNVIRLDVEQEVSDVEAANYNGLGPATSKRSTKTTVVARDQQTVVIGGLMSDRASETITKVPILGDIPVIGFFFRSTTKDLKKTNILIAITPYVISDLSDLRRVAEKKMRERREFIERYSSLEDRVSLDKDMDFRRKRGMLEEINKTVREMEEEEKELRDIRTRDEGDDSTAVEPVSANNAPPAVPAAEDTSPAAPADNMDEEPPAEERLMPASPPAPKLKGRARRIRKATTAAPSTAASAAAAPSKAAPPAATPVKPAPAPAKE